MCHKIICSYHNFYLKMRKSADYFSAHSHFSWRDKESGRWQHCFWPSETLWEYRNRQKSKNSVKCSTMPSKKSNILQNRLCHCNGTQSLTFTLKIELLHVGQSWRKRKGRQNLLDISYGHIFWQKFNSVTFLPLQHRFRVILYDLDRNCSVCFHIFETYFYLK